VSYNDVTVFCVVLSCWIFIGDLFVYCIYALCKRVDVPYVVLIFYSFVT